jgi:hypothetical protein
MLLIPDGQTLEAWETFQKAMLFQKFGSVGYNSTFTFFHSSRDKKPASQLHTTP